MFEKFHAGRGSAPSATIKPDLHAISSAPGVEADAGLATLDLRVALHQRMIDKINLHALETMTRAEVSERIRPLVSKLLVEEKAVLNGHEYDRLLDEILDEVLGLGPLEPLLKDPTIADI